MLAGVISGWVGEETLMASREVVLGVTPKRRKDSAIYTSVNNVCTSNKAGQGRR